MPDLVPIVVALLAVIGLGCGALGWLLCWLTATRSRHHRSEAVTADHGRIPQGASKADRLVRGDADTDLAALADEVRTRRLQRLSQRLADNDQT